MSLLWEAMVDEMRAERAELDHRRHFTEAKKPIELTRTLLAGWTDIAEDEDLEVVAARSGTHMRTAAESDLIEVG